MNRFAAALAVLILAPTAALASQQGVIAMKKWKAMDVCAKAAQAAFPDFTPQSNALREAKLQQCLEAQNLPPRTPLAPHQ